MDAVTSFELEAQRRRETIASDRDQSWARVNRWTEAVEAKAIEPRLQGRRVGGQPECEPGPLARQAVG